MFRPAIAVVAAAGCASAIAACGSSGSATAKSGTETFSGSTTSMSGTPVVPLHARGVVSDTGRLTLGGGPRPGQAVFRLEHGEVQVHHSAGVASRVRVISATQCRFGRTSRGTYTVTGGTRSYRGVTGHGHYLITFTATLPKLSNGQCNESQRVRPVSVLSTFRASGPFKLP